MSQRTQKIAYLSFAGLALMLIALGLIFRHALDGYTPTPRTSFLQRCGTTSIVFMMLCAAAAAIVALIEAITHFFVAYRLEKGHSHRGLTVSRGIAGIACFFVFSISFWNRWLAPCWMTPAFYFAVFLAISWRGIHTLARRSMLERTQTVRLSNAIKEVKEIQALQEQPDRMTTDKDDRIAVKLVQILENLEHIAANPIARTVNDREGA